MPFLSFIVGFRNREIERVKLFLDNLLRIYHNDFELIFIDYGSSKEVSTEVKDLVSKYDFATYYFFNSRGQNWNRAKCLNYGATKSKGQFIFTSDIDFLFSKNFIPTIQRTIKPNKALYFKVGFLTQKQSQNIQFETEKYKIESYSNEDAIGALLISRQMFEEVGGYDEFYEIWGVEDNDMLHRIKMTTNEIHFYNTDTLIWHIWHLPVKNSNILPKGWVKFLKDYFEHKKQSISSCNENYYCHLDQSRPILSNKGNIEFKEIDVKCSSNYLNLLIKQELLQLKPNCGLKINFNFEQVIKINKTSLNKFVRIVNPITKIINSSLIIENINMYLYLDENSALNTLQYFIKNNSEIIVDYYMPDDISKEAVYILKR